MNAPATADEFLDLVRKSGVVEDRRLAAYLEQERPASPLPGEPKKLAECLVRDGLLTHFQAEQFLQGKWRRFTIGNYKVLERIGSGGMGSVFLCEHKFMRRRAAVKVLPISQSNDPSALQRFYREARAVAALDHPNIVRAYDIDQEDNLHFLVMEYVDGSSLQEIIQRVGPLDAVRCAHYISQAALGLQHAHEVAGLVHRDIKPGNIIIDRGGTVKVLDLGLARFFHDEDDLLTKKFDENVLGTADYLAPEQALDSHGVDIRGDIYSLGGTFYFCLTGLSPFAEGTVAQKLIWHQTRQPKPIRASRSDVPEEMIAILAKMMAKDPNQRYQTPLEVAQALEPWTQNSIAPPAEVEMPRLSLAARGSGGIEPKSSLVTPSPSGLLSARSRKVWQVPPSSTPQPNGRSAPPAALPSKPAPTVPAAATPKARDARLVPKPIPASPRDKPPEAAGVDPALLPEELQLADSVEQAAEPPSSHALSSAKEEDSVPWTELATETENHTAQADTEPRRPKKSAPRRLRAGKALAQARRRRQQRGWWLGGVGGGVLLILVGVLVWAFVGGNKDKSAEETPVGPPPLLVSHSGRDKAFRSLSEAIHKAKDKDRIVVVDDLEEQLELTGSNKELFIQAEPGKKVVWRFPRNVASAREMLLLNGVGHIKFQGFTIDGHNRVEQIMLLTGHCPGLTFQDIHLHGFRKYGILLANCAGKDDQPVTLMGVQAPTTENKEAFVAFAANPRVISPKLNQHIIIRECQFAGPYKNPVQLIGDKAVIDHVEFSHNMPPILITAPK